MTHTQTVCGMDIEDVQIGDDAHNVRLNLTGTVHGWFDTTLLVRTVRGIESWDAADCCIIMPG